MIRTADLSGAQLDYHTARAQGIPAEHLEIRRVPRTDTLICVHRIPCEVPGRPSVEKRFNPSGDWHLAGPLIEQHRLAVRPKGGYWLVEEEAIGWLKRRTAETPCWALSAAPSCAPRSAKKLRR